MTREEAVFEVVEELATSLKAYPKKFHSAHEGFAILKEEVDELWDAVRLSLKGEQDHRQQLMRYEAIQVAAMALRFLIEVV